MELSYVLTTRNKLPMLKAVLAGLLAQKQPGEELIVIDAASTDGTVEYLQQLHQAGRVDQFISEPDHGEAHGYNKGLLLARGELIKVITDDDAFYWPGIQAGKQFMLAHPQVNALGTDFGGTDSQAPDQQYRIEYRSRFEQHQARSRPFDFCGLGLMLRRSSLPSIGLFHTGIKRVDYEFTRRLTTGLAQLAWHTACVAFRVLNHQSNTVTQHDRITNEGRRIAQFYAPPEMIAAPPSVWGQLKNRLRPIKNWLCRPHGVQTPPANPHPIPVADWPAAFAAANIFLETENRRWPGEFLGK